MAVTAAGLTDAEGAQVWASATVPQSALLTVLPLVTLRTATLLHPAGWKAGTLPGRHQGDVVKVTGACRGREQRCCVLCAEASWDVNVSLPVSRTSLTVGAANLDGSQIIEKFLEVSVADGWSPGVVGAVMEPEPQDNSLSHTKICRRPLIAWVFRAGPRRSLF